MSEARKVAIAEPQAMQVEPISDGAAIIDMIARAARDPQVDLSKMERLFGIRKEIMASEAMKAFNQAVAAAKGEIPPIIKNRTGHNSKAYADFAAIAKAVDPILAKHGLSYRFRTKQDERIHVTCVLSHEAGHFEETTLSGPADSTGNKNAIQSIGSTLTYLQRYSLVQALGLAAAGDDDGVAAGNGELLDDKQVEAIQSLIVEVGADIPKFLKYFKVERIADIPAKHYQRAIDALEAKRAKQ